MKKKIRKSSQKNFMGGNFLGNNILVGGRQSSRGQFSGDNFWRGIFPGAYFLELSILPKRYKSLHSVAILILQLLLEQILKLGNGRVIVSFHKSVYDFKISNLQTFMK